MRSDRYFYSAVGAFLVLCVFYGFHLFFLHRIHSDGTPIAASILPYVVVHGLAITVWFLLFFVQSLLIGVKKRKLHMTLGWSGVAVGLTIACLTPIVAIHSVKLAPTVIFYGWIFSRFLMSMLMDAATFTFFAAAGFLTRKKPVIHRAMMMMACMSLLDGAFSRITLVHLVFGEIGWMGMYGPVFCFGVLLLVVHFGLTRRFDKWFALGLTGWAIAEYGAIYFAQNTIWDGIVSRIIAL
jgi:hypothetical protein